MVQLVQQQLSPDGKARIRGWISQWAFGLCCNPEEVSSNTSKGMPQQQVDELASKSKVKQAKSKSFLLPCSFSRLPEDGVAQN